MYNSLGNPEYDICIIDIIAIIDIIDLMWYNDILFDIMAIIHVKNHNMYNSKIIENNANKRKNL